MCHTLQLSTKWRHTTHYFSNILPCGSNSITSHKRKTLSRFRWFPSSGANHLSRLPGWNLPVLHIFQHIRWSCAFVHNCPYHGWYSKLVHMQTLYHANNLVLCSLCFRFSSSLTLILLMSKWLCYVRRDLVLYRFQTRHGDLTRVISDLASCFSLRALLWPRSNSVNIVYASSLKYSCMCRSADASFFLRGCWHH